jgi:hypothetical protein
MALAGGVVYAAGDASLFALGDGCGVRIGDLLERRTSPLAYRPGGTRSTTGVTR